MGALLAGMLVSVVVWWTTERWFAETFFIPQFGGADVSHGNVIGPVTVCVLVVILYARAPLRQAAIVCISPVGYLLFPAGLRRSFVMMMWLAFGLSLAAEKIICKEDGLGVAVPSGNQSAVTT